MRDSLTDHISLRRIMRSGLFRTGSTGRGKAESEMEIAIGHGRGASDLCGRSLSRRDFRKENGTRLTQNGPRFAFPA